jgi:hypothetical protein
MTALVAAASTGALAVLLLLAGVTALAALEARLLDPRRGVVGTLVGAVRLARAAPRPSSDHALAAAAAVLAVSVPVAAGVLLVGDPRVRPVAGGLLCLGAAAPLLASVAAGVDERARLGLFDALAATTRRLSALVACALAAPSTAGTLVVVVLAVVVLVRSRHRGTATLLPRWEDGVHGSALLAHRLGERATVVTLAIAAGVAVPGLVDDRLTPFAERVAVVAVPVVVIVVAVVIVRRLGPLQGEGVTGPLWLLALASCARIVG